jgi:3',5'-nucleoside bisphosphate phosphatase
MVDFDLQSHSVFSDGALPPAEVVGRAAQAGITLLAVSDHDTVDGVGEAIASGARHGVRIVSAVELSAVHDGREDLHVLGYAIDHTDATLLERLRGYREDRFARGERMAALLREQGWELDDAPLRRRAEAGRPVGRPHLAHAAFDHRGNAERIRAEGLETFSDLLVAYLIPGRPAYAPRTTPTVPEAIAAIHDAGGVAVWAHPFWDVDAGEEVLATIDAFVGDGLDGVEVFYPTHGREQVALLAGRCARDGLLQTGSADFHGPDHPEFSRFGAFELYGREPVLGPIVRSSR